MHRGKGLALLLIGAAGRQDEYIRALEKYRIRTSATERAEEGRTGAGEGRGTQTQKFDPKNIKQCEKICDECRAVARRSVEHRENQRHRLREGQRSRLDTFRYSAGARASRRLPGRDQCD